MPGESFPSSPVRSHPAPPLSLASSSPLVSSKYSTVILWLLIVRKEIEITVHVTALGRKVLSPSTWKYTVKVLPSLDREVGRCVILEENIAVAKVFV